MDHLCYFCLVFVMLFIDALWSPARKGLTSYFSFVMSNCEVVTFPLVFWVWCGACLIVSIPDLCPFSYFNNTDLSHRAPSAICIAEIR